MYLDDAVKAIANFEGRVAWMYLDTRGYVTVGIGQMIPNSGAALRYPFRKSNNELANNQDIQHEYETVAAMRPGMLASAYRRADSLLLPDDEMNLIFREKLTNCAIELTTTFNDFPDYPDQAKVALLDMDYNLGLTKLRNGFPSFCNAVRTRRWLLASKECHRLDQPEARNVWAAEKFFQASQ